MNSGSDSSSSCGILSLLALVRLVAVLSEVSASRSIVECIVECDVFPLLEFLRVIFFLFWSFRVLED